MGLTKKQRKQIRQETKDSSLEKIADELKINPKEIEDYLKKIWRKEKYQKFLAREKKQEKQISSLILKTNFNFKNWLKQNWRQLAFLAFLVLGVYFNSLNNEFLSDDIAQMKDITTLENQYIKKIFKPPFIAMRPFIVFLTYKFFGLNAAFFRFSNIIFHLGSAWIVFLLINFFFKPPLPLFTASIFAVHPILTESVTWISGGPYSNSAFFALLSLILYMLSRRSKNLYFFSILSYIIAFMFSEKLVIFIFAFILFELIFGQFKKNLSRLTPFILISGLFFLNLVGLVGIRISSLEAIHYQKPGLTNPLIQIPIAISSYLELIFWPKNLTLYHSEMIFSQSEYFFKLGIFIFFLTAIIYFFKKDRRIFFWLLFFLIPLLPTLTPLGISWIVAERYAYLASLGIFVFIALILQKIGKIAKNQKVSYVLFAIILLALSVRTIMRNIDWKNQDNLWLAAAKTSPSSSQNHNNLGDYYGRQGDLKKAVEEFKIAIQLKPGYADAYHNLANTYQQMGETDKAIKNYQIALSFNPNLWQSHQNLGTIYFIIQEEFELAKQEFEKAIKINPQNSNLFNSLGIIYLKLGGKEKAKETFSKALQIDPQNERARQELLLLE